MRVARGEGLRVEGPVAAAAEMLADRQDLALVAVERTRMPMVVTDPRKPDCPIVLANQAFLDLSGYAADEVLGRNCRFLQGPDTSPETVRRLSEGLARHEAIDVELLNYRRDGSSFWNALHLSPVHDQAGRLAYYFGSQWDVSERYRADVMRAAELRLLREVDHRAMNALALVQGFVRLSRRDSVETFARSVEGRVDVLARTHTLLAQTRWADITLEAVLQSELVVRAGGRALLSGPPVLVPADRVQALALLIHELAANALLHGALSGSEGRVEVSWRPGPALGLVDLSWRERGGPPSAPGEAGFGLRLVNSIVRQQLQGRLSQQWTEEGLLTELTCRIAA
jgi:PAS domain S-box-containing protein